MAVENWIDKNLKSIDYQRFQEYFGGGYVEYIDKSTYYVNTSKGIDMVIDESGSITTIHLFSGKTKGTEKFVGQLVKSITFDMKRGEIRNLMGLPDRSGGGYLETWGEVPRWDKYYCESYSLHLQYSQIDESIELLTLGSLRLESYLNR